MPEKPSVLIYCDQLLPYSATFIRSQAETLQRFTPYYVGCRRIPGLPLPDTKTFVANRGGVIGNLEESIFKLFGYAPALAQDLQQIQASLIHAHFGPDGIRALPLSRQLGIPLVVTFHGYDATVKDDFARKASVSHRTYLKRKAILQQDAHSFIAVSKFIENQLLKQGFPSDKVIVHYIGIDTKIFNPNPALPREPIVLFVGRLVEKKGGEYLIRAMHLVQKVLPEAKLVVIGEGPLRASLEQLAQQMLGNYCFLGAQSPETVRTWMNRSQVFSVPSVIAQSGDSEAFGIVFAEAQAMRLPVVSFASGGIPEAVTHGETGFLAPEKDWQTLANYILKLLQDQTLWHQFSYKGQERVEKHFNLDHQTRILEHHYSSILATNKVSPIDY